MLQHHGKRIQPGIQRIVWLYKRWQPLYTVIQRSTTPNVEFIQGIPPDLDDDDFFDTRVNNLLILDDLFSETGKDKRITDLFTEGSHHRSLSLISICQSLYGNKDPTQRRNCHYLVLFNNPVDKQSVMTLARQMYPGYTEKFMKTFSKATKYPYGYLLVDLKPFTPEDDRLRYDLKWKHKQCIHDKSPHELTNHMQESLDKTIQVEETPEINHSSIGVQTDHIAESTDNEDMEKGQPCDDCGVLFDSTHDVQRHVKSGNCPENMDNNKRKHDEISDSDQEGPVEDNDAYVHLWKRAKESTEDKFDRIYNNFRSDGEDSDDAREMAGERVQPFTEKAFFSNYTMLLNNYMLPLKNNELHNQILAQINKLLSQGQNTTTAVTKVLRKHKNSFQDLFDIELSDEESEAESEEEQTDAE